MITEKMAETISHFATQNEQLQKKLDIAVKALREYADEGNWCDCLSWNGFIEDNEVVCNGQFGENGFEPARQALKEIDDSFEKCDEN